MGEEKRKGNHSVFDLGREGEGGVKKGLGQQRQKERGKKNLRREGEDRGGASSRVSFLIPPTEHVGGKRDIKARWRRTAEERGAADKEKGTFMT